MPDTPEMKCFVVSPIGAPKSPERAAADIVLKHLIKKSLSDDYVVTRADDEDNPGSITPQIISAILEADLVVADLTDFNPNVFYELAIAHGYHRPTVHLIRSDQKAPFDVKDMRIIQYDTTDPDDLEAAQKRLKDYARFAVEHPEKVETPLSSADRFTVVASSTDPVVESNVQIMDAIGDIRSDLKRVLGRVSSRRAPHEDGERYNGDRRSLVRIIRRVVQAGRAEPSDFQEVITGDTTSGFDSWVKKQLGTVMARSDDDPSLGDILYHSNLLIPLVPDEVEYDKPDDDV